MTDENSNSKIVVSFDGVKVKEFRFYWTAVARGDWAGQDKFFAQVVKSWPFELDPAKPEAYGKLELAHYLAVQATIRANSSKIVQLRLMRNS